MPDAGDERPLEEQLVEVRREFSRLLPSRIAELQAALVQVADGDPAGTEVFYRAAHTLKGTAGTFAGPLLGQPADRLDQLARAWRRGGAAAPGEVAEARAVLAQLEVAARRFGAEVEGR